LILHSTRGLKKFHVCSSAHPVSHPNEWETLVFDPIFPETSAKVTKRFPVRYHWRWVMVLFRLSTWCRRPTVTRWTMWNSQAEKWQGKVPDLDSWMHYSRVSVR
jgi:hypothetical protein